MQRAELLVHECARSGTERLQVEAVVLEELLHLLAAGVVAEERDKPVAVRKKIDGGAAPHGVTVHRVIPGNLLEIECLEVDEPDRCRLAAAITLPGTLPRLEGDVGQCI